MHLYCCVLLWRKKEYIYIINDGIMERVVVKVPCVSLLGSLVWHPNEFMYAKLPHMASALDRKALASVAANRLAYLQQTTQSLAS